MTAADRPSVTDNARADAERRYVDSGLLYRETFVAGYEAGWAAGRAETTTADVRAECGCDLSVGPNALHIVDGHDGAAARAETTTAYEPCVIGVGGRCTRWSHNHSAETATDNLGDAYMLGYSAAAQRAEATTEATERIARQIAASTAMTGTDAREYVEAIQALQRAETTTATAEDAARVLFDQLWTEDRDYERAEVREIFLTGYESGVDAAGLLARPLPDRDELAEAISDSDTVPCDVCADSRCRYCWGDACRKADAVLGLLRGGGGDR